MNALTNGLEEFTIPEATTETKGADEASVKTACNQLNDQATAITVFANNLEAQMQDMLIDWQGDAADKFKSTIPVFMESFRKIAPCLQSISEWASTTTSNYSSADTAFEQALGQIYGGK